MLKFGLSLGRIGHVFPDHGVPVVVQSTIGDVQHDGITVIWDRPMSVTCDVKSQINVLVDGNPTTVTDVVFHPSSKSTMGILVTPDFEVGQSVTWAYDDTGGCILQQIEPPNTEADGNTNVVYNDLLSMTADSTLITCDSTTITADRG